MPCLHLPVQSGSDRVLEAMNRRHDRDLYLSVIERVRAARPDIAVSSDFIVGFPGETEDDFAATLDLVERVGFAQAYSFKYSPRPGTPAAEMEQIDEAVKAERLARLQDLLERQQRAFNRSLVGRTLDVLFEKPGRLAGQIVGRSPYLQPVQVNAPQDRIGTIAAVRVVEAGAKSLVGEIVAAANARKHAERGTRRRRRLMRNPDTRNASFRQGPGRPGADRRRLRRQPAREHLVRSLRRESRADRAPPQCGGRPPRQPRDAGGRKDRLRAGAARAHVALRATARRS